MSTKHNDKLGMIFNLFSDFQSSIQKSIQTVTERVDRIKASTLVETKIVTSIPEKLILERKIKLLAMYRISDRLRIDGLESCINAGIAELRVGEVIIWSPQYLKAHLVATNCEGMDFGSFVFPYNIPTRIQQKLKGEETLAEVVKHKKYSASLNMSEDETITVYTFSIFTPGLFGGKRSTKSYIVTLPNYTKWRNKYLQTGLGYDIEKMFDPVHQYIKIIIAM